MICFYSAYRSGAVRKQLLLKLRIFRKKRITAGALIPLEAVQAGYVPERPKA
jgi:hypothetical protein